MAKISRNKLDPQVYSAILRQLSASIANLKGDNEVAGLINSLFTKTEKLMLAKRLAIAMLLERGITYSDISSALKVSSVTIGFVRNSIMKHNENYSRLIKSLNKNVPLKI